MRNPQFSLGPMVVTLGIAGPVSVGLSTLSMAEVVVQWVRAQNLGFKWRRIFRAFHPCSTEKKEARKGERRISKDLGSLLRMAVASSLK
jgi:hypothetical protein